MRHQNADVRAHQQIVRLRGKDLFQSSEAGHDPNILPFTTLSRTTYWRRSMSLLQHTCRYVRSLSPYASLFLVVIARRLSQKGLDFACDQSVTALDAPGVIARDLPRRLRPLRGFGGDGA